MAAAKKKPAAKRGPWKMTGKTTAAKKRAPFKDRVANRSAKRKPFKDR